MYYNIWIKFLCIYKVTYNHGRIQINSFEKQFITCKGGICGMLKLCQGIFNIFEIILCLIVIVYYSNDLPNTKSIQKMFLTTFYLSSIKTQK